MRAAGARVIALELRFNRALKSLDLSGNNIGSDIDISHGGGWTHDPNAFRKYVHTDGRKTDNRPDGVDFEADLSGIQALAGALKVNRSLKSANLSSNKLGTGGIRALCDALKTNNSLESLTIQNPDPDDTKIDACLLYTSPSPRDRG